MSNSSEIGLAISNIGMLIVAARRSIRQLVAGKVVPLDLTPHHFWMLMVIVKAAPLSLGELAREARRASLRTEITPANQPA